MRKPNYKKRLWKLFSEYIRRRGADEDGMVACFSCGRIKHWKELDAGHYVAKKKGTSIYFEEKNVHPQCTFCNRYMRGNLDQYALALIKKYGKGILEELDTLRRTHRQIRDAEYEELIEAYKKKLARLPKIKESV